MLRWTVTAQGQDEILVRFDGEIVGQNDYSELIGRPERMVLDLGRVRRINSIGAQWFTHFLDAVGARMAIDVVNCPVAVVTHVNILPALAQRLRVRSLFVPFECPKCLLEREHLVEVPQPGQRPVLPKLSCAGCGTTLQLSDLEERYFAFFGR